MEKANQMIVVNARFLTQDITGVQRFAVEISKILKKKLSNKVLFVSHSGIIHHELAKELDVKIIGVNKSHLWEQFDLYFFLLRNKNPLLLSFGYTGPLLYKNQIVSIHDMAFKYYRETFSKSFAFTYNFIVPKIAKKCLHIFTVSNSAKDEICKELNLSKNKITVIYNGLSDFFKTDGIVPVEKKKEKRYILTVSSHHPRKNYKRLVQSFYNIKDDSIHLYIVGKVINHFTNDFQDDKLKQERISFLTNVSDIELKNYYKGAELFVFPSLYEGFGIPVIEAMNFNLPCVISEIPVFKEIGDESVIYVDPQSISSITKGIEKGLKLKSKRIIYPKLKKFTWYNSAEKVINILNQFHEQRN